MFKTVNHSKEHDQEHQEWSRRSFLQALGIGCTGSMLLGSKMLSASSSSPLAMALNTSENDNILILVRFAGGNDGLNTIVPVYDFDTYANHRPTIYHKEQSLIQLDNDFSIPNHMESLESMWGEGLMKVAHGVGYDPRSLSHFTSSDIWATGKTNVDDFTKGWLGGYFNEAYPDFISSPPENPLAIQIGSVGNLLFSYEEQQYAFLVSNPQELEDVAKNGVKYEINNIDSTCKIGKHREFLRATYNSTFSYSGAISAAYNSTENIVEYEDNSIAKQFAIIARLIKGNLGTKTYMATLGGFDTHANQTETHAELLGTFSKAVDTFYKDIKQTGHDEKVLSMTFSEFGRRVSQNGSNGTDHGTAAPCLFFGKALNGNGFVGEHPSLSDLDNNGNLKYNIDFRRLYASVLSQWLCIDKSLVDAALGGSYENIDLGFSCTTDADVDSDTENPDSDGPIEIEDIPEEYSHTPIYDNEGRPSISLNLNRAMHIDIQLYNILGQQMGTLKNSFMTEGSHIVDIEDALKGGALTTGKYIYRVSTYDGNSSKMILVK
ncbi:DUF1501 domain-containing protein [Maribacter sp. IgM3_T14_3]|uniref:DUF1501 domain-containing protein n=1 Tax=Maribacter sp. IgM3_T14_3 TaxID=3415140 RepID=UPI003C6FADFD